MTAEHHPFDTSWPVGTLSVPGFEVMSGVHEPASVLARHSHPTPTICCVRHGRFTEYYPGKAVDCDPRTLKLTPAGEPHWNRFASAPTYGIRIDVDESRFDGAPHIRSMFGERLFLSAGNFDVLMRELVVELKRGDELSAIAAEGLLLELLARMARQTQKVTALLPAWLVRADEVAHETYRAPMSVARIAELVGVTAPTLARWYRKAFGCTLAQRMRELRLEAAARDLLLSDRPITDVALNAGFYDQSHFSNAFRRHFGLPPAAYRQRMAAGLSVPGRQPA
ncbi:AraC family transcriptional regulator [soil metagenome]